MKLKKQQQKTLAIDQNEIIKTWLDSNITFTFWSTSLSGAAGKQGDGPMQSCILHFIFSNDQKHAKVYVDYNVK